MARGAAESQAAALRALEKRRGPSIGVLKRLREELVQKVSRDEEISERLAAWLSGKHESRRYLFDWLQRHLDPDECHRIVEGVGGLRSGKPSSTTLQLLLGRALGLGFFRHNHATHESYCHWLLCEALGDDTRLRLIESMKMPRGTGSNGGIERFLLRKIRKQQRTIALWDAFQDPRGRVAVEDMVAGTRSVLATVLMEPGGSDAQSAHEAVEGAPRPFGILYCFFPVEGLFIRPPANINRACKTKRRVPFAAKFEQAVDREVHALRLAIDKEILEEELNQVYAVESANRAVAREGQRLKHERSEDSPVRLLDRLVPSGENPDDPTGFQFAVWAQENNQATVTAQQAFFVRFQQLLQLAHACPEQWVVTDRTHSSLSEPLVKSLQHSALRLLSPLPVECGPQFPPPAAPDDTLSARSAVGFGGVRDLILHANSQIRLAIRVHLDSGAALEGKRRYSCGRINDKRLNEVLKHLESGIRAAPSLETLKGLLDLRQSLGRMIAGVLVDREPKTELLNGADVELALAAILPEIEQGRAAKYAKAIALLRPRAWLRDGGGVRLVSVWAGAERFVITDGARCESSPAPDRLFLSDPGLLETLRLLVEYHGRRCTRKAPSRFKGRLSSYHHWTPLERVSERLAEPGEHGWIAQGPSVISPAVAPDGTALFLDLNASRDERDAASVVTSLSTGPTSTRPFRVDLTWQLQQVLEPIAVQPAPTVFRTWLIPVPPGMCFDGLHGTTPAGEFGIPIEGLSTFDIYGQDSDRQHALGQFRRNLCHSGISCAEDGLCERLANYITFFSRPKSDETRPQLKRAVIHPGLPRSSDQAQDSPADARLLTFALVGGEADVVVKARDRAVAALRLEVKDAVRRWRERNDERFLGASVQQQAVAHEIGQVAELIRLPSKDASDPREIFRQPVWPIKDYETYLSRLSEEEAKNVAKQVGRNGVLSPYGDIYRAATSYIELMSDSKSASTPFDDWPGQPLVSADGTAGALHKARDYAIQAAFGLWARKVHVGMKTLDAQALLGSITSEAAPQTSEACLASPLRFWTTPPASSSTS